MSHVSEKLCVVATRQTKLASIITSYHKQLVENCKTLEQLAKQLEQGNWQNRQELANIFFMVHRLAGSCSTMGFLALGKTALKAERILAAYKNIDRPDKKLPGQQDITVIRRLVRMIYINGQAVTVEDSALMPKR